MHNYHNIKKANNTSYVSWIQIRNPKNSNVTQNNSDKKYSLAIQYNCDSKRHRIWEQTIILTKLLKTLF